MSLLWLVWSMEIPWRAMSIKTWTIFLNWNYNALDTPSIEDELFSDYSIFGMQRHLFYDFYILLNMGCVVSTIYWKVVSTYVYNCLVMYRSHKKDLLISCRRTCCSILWSQYLILYSLQKWICCALPGVGATQILQLRMVKVMLKSLKVHSLESCLAE